MTRRQWSGGYASPLPPVTQLPVVPSGPAPGARPAQCSPDCAGCRRCGYLQEQEQKSQRRQPQSVASAFDPDLDLVDWGSHRARRDAERREADRLGIGRWHARGLFVIIRSH